ncbi:MAG TPA: hypothetical protein VHH11_15660 [Gammaproteobacteria bacterium]|nr:hypothetical protein [Gammaproteobacteria bacterium]
MKLGPVAAAGEAREMDGGGDRAPARRRRITAGIVLGGVAALLVMSGGRPRDVSPSRVRPASVVPESALRMMPAAATASRRRVSVVFVSARCAACRQLVAAVQRDDHQPCAEGGVVFVTDSAWDALREVARGGGWIVERGDAMARAFGIRATPTLVAIGPAERHVSRIEVGAVTVRDYLVGERTSCHARPGGA